MLIKKLGSISIHLTAHQVLGFKQPIPNLDILYDPRISSQRQIIEKKFGLQVLRPATHE